MWQAVIAFKDYLFKTETGLPFRYKLKVGKNGEYNRELMIDRREKSMSLAWSGVVLALYFHIIFFSFYFFHFYHNKIVPKVLYLLNLGGGIKHMEVV